MANFLKFGLAFKYRNPAMILSDGVIGQMMEKVELFDYIPRLSDEQVAENCPWATTGKKKGIQRRIITSLNLVPHLQEQFNQHLVEKYKTIQDTEVMCEQLDCEDADYIIVAYGSSARTSMKAVQMAREKGLKAGLLRPQTLWPFPIKQIQSHLSHAKGFLSVEMSAGQMVEDVRLAVNGKVPVEHYGRMGGMIASPADILQALENFKQSIN